MPKRKIGIQHTNEEIEKIRKEIEDNDNKPFIIETICIQNIIEKTIDKKFNNNDFTKMIFPNKELDSTIKKEIIKLETQFKDAEIDYIKFNSHLPKI
ncbi:MULTISPECIES: hypothetical protein [unclassified Spiroplasma]|uniref:hypothetical protein n=1 Tax=unclassified Spiroplasma TaxID=2637901 RepID=UPI00207A429D|nr:hypothetical protein [Spiroplasma endosymbiont of Lariophagus distinguendus]